MGTGLSIQSGLSCVQMTPERQLCAEPGHQIVIVDFPSLTSPMLFSTTLSFNVMCPPAGCAPFDVKPLFTIAVTTGGQTFHLPLALCLEDIESFADIPVRFTIPVSSDPQELTFVVDPVSRLCPQQSALLAGRLAVGAPMLGQRALVLLAAFVGLVGVQLVRRRHANRTAPGA